MKRLSRLVELFEDENLLNKIRGRLPYLFQIAELESSRAGKVGMEVGSVREKILTALLIFKFGEKNIETGIPITEPEVDVRLFGEPVSIKTITGTSGVKVIWTVDPQKAREFLENYHPKCDILLVQIKWGEKGWLSCIPRAVQERTLESVGREAYIRLPKPGTNPRGVELGKEALAKLVTDKGSRSVDILWKRDEEMKYDPYQRWVEYWMKE